MKNIKQTFLKLLKDESGQGMAEYILLLVVVIAIAALFREQLMNAVRQKMESITGSIQGFNP